MTGLETIRHWNEDLRREVEANGKAVCYASVSGAIVEEVNTDSRKLIEAVGGEVLHVVEMLARAGCKRFKIVKVDWMADGAGLTVDVEGVR